MSAAGQRDGIPPGLVFDEPAAPEVPKGLVFDEPAVAPGPTDFVFDEPAPPAPRIVQLATGEMIEEDPLSTPFNEQERALLQSGAAPTPEIIRKAVENTLRQIESGGVDIAGAPEAAAAGEKTPLSKLNPVNLNIEFVKGAARATPRTAASVADLLSREASSDRIFGGLLKKLPGWAQTVVALASGPLSQIETRDFISDKFGDLSTALRTWEAKNPELFENPQKRAFFDQIANDPVGGVERVASNLGEMAPYMAATLTARALGGPAAAGYISYGIEGDAAKQEALANGATEDQAEVIYHVVGSINAALEVAGLEALMKAFPGLKQLIVRKAASEVAKQGIKSIGKRSLAKILGISIEVVTEIAQEFTTKEAQVQSLDRPELRLTLEQAAEVGGTAAIAAGLVGGGGGLAARVGRQQAPVDTDAAAAPPVDVERAAAAKVVGVSEPAVSALSQVLKAVSENRDQAFLTGAAEGSAGLTEMQELAEAGFVEQVEQVGDQIRWRATGKLPDTQAVTAAKEAAVAEVKEAEKAAVQKAAEKPAEAPARKAEAAPAKAKVAPAEAPKAPAAEVTPAAEGEVAAEAPAAEDVAAGVAFTERQTELQAMNFTALSDIVKSRQLIAGSPATFTKNKMVEAILSDEGLSPPAAEAAPPAKQRPAPKAAPLEESGGTRPEGTPNPATDETIPEATAGAESLAERERQQDAATTPEQKAKAAEVEATSEPSFKETPTVENPDPTPPARDDVTYMAGGLGLGGVNKFAEAAQAFAEGKPLTELRRTTEGMVLSAVRARRSKVLGAELRAADWRDRLSEEELEDVGAMVEKTGNLTTGKSAEQVRADATPEQLRVLAEYREAQETMRREVNLYIEPSGEKEYIAFLEDYLPHFYVGGKKKMSTAANSWVRKNSPNARKRKIPTLAEARNLGLKPLTQNVSTLHKMWAQINWQVATTRKLMADIRTFEQPDGQPIIMKPGEDVPDDWIFSDHPAIAHVFARRAKDGTLILWRGGGFVQPDAWRALRQVIEKPFQGRFVAAIEGFNAYSKKLALSLSFFHAGALTESSAATVGPIKGLVNRKGITFRTGLSMLEDPAFYEDAVAHGLMLGASTDVAVGRIQKNLLALEAVTRHIPVLKTVTRAVRRFNEVWDRALWDKYHRGLKAYAYFDLTERFLSNPPKGYTVDQIKESVAEVVNDAYGGQEWEAKFWLSPKARQVMHWTLLAPDWTVSNLSIATKPIFRGQIPRRAGARYWINMGVFLGSTTVLLNYIFSGHGPWDNEDEHKSDIEVTGLMRRLPWADPNDKQRYYMHFGKQAREVIGWATNFWKMLGSKFSPGLQVGIEQITGHSAGSGFPLEWKRDDFYEPTFAESAPMRVKAVAAKFLPFSLRGANFAFTAPLSKGMTPFKAKRTMVSALRAFAEPSFFASHTKGAATKEDLQALVRDTMDAAESNGLDADRLFGQSLGIARSHYYGKLFSALEKQDEDGVNEAAESLKLLATEAENVWNSARSRQLPPDIRDRAADLFGGRQTGGRGRPTGRGTSRRSTRRTGRE